MKLRPRTIQLASGTKLTIRPHIGEFDFQALFSRSISYERDVFKVLAQRMSQYRTIVEIGANVGIYTAFFANAFACQDPNRAVFAFEPSREAFKRLLDNFEHNP